MDVSLKTATWKYNKTWVYSATYDEGLIELHRFTVPAHDRLCVPGHVEVVGGHLGVERRLGASSYNGMRHMSGGEIRELLDRGWGVGNHSWSHGIVEDDLELELKKSKDAIEEACRYPVTLYTAPGSNVNMSPPVLEALPKYGYLGGMGITDDINRPDFGIWINRPPLHEKFSDLYDSAFDPHKRIAQAKKHNGWIVDYLHCPLEKAVHDYKDVSAAHLGERLETVVAEGKYDCWFANPDRVADYRYMRGAVKILEKGPGRFELDISAARKEIVCKDLTFSLKSAYPAGQLAVSADGRDVSVQQFANGEVVFTIEVKNKMEIDIIPRNIRIA